ncbi:MetQ/NlpA family ABC transporter substrate-binding protein [Niallia sp. 01092]|uniref:MetQ/NlpA family ABC transporter substrate-binding protein n=1 Tax=Niallia sp. 01092 TaxID=3457759 RepID=UPI003FD04038
MRKWLVSILTVVLVLVVSACGSKDTNGTAGDSNKVTVGSSGSDAQAWQFIAKSDAAKKAGLDITVKEFSDGLQINNATADGLVDVNAFQSLSYFQDYNKQKDNALVAISTTYLEPMGIYSQKIKSIDKIPNGVEVAIPNDAANTARALRVLKAAGLITLKPDFISFSGVNSIASNPKNLKFTEVDGKTTARVLPDVDLALVGNSVALDAGLNSVKDSIYHEEINQDTEANINILVTKKGRENDKTLAKLHDLYHTKEVQDYIKKEFGGTKIPVDKPVDSIIDNK